MPELPEVEAVRREIVPAMQGARFEHVLVRRANLRIPFPWNFAGRLKGQQVHALTRRGKYLLAGLSSGDWAMTWSLDGKAPVLLGPDAELCADLVRAYGERE